MLARILWCKTGFICCFRCDCMRTVVLVNIYFSIQDKRINLKHRTVRCNVYSGDIFLNENLIIFVTKTEDGVINNVKQWAKLVWNKYELLWSRGMCGKWGGNRDEMYWETKRYGSRARRYVYRKGITGVIQLIFRVDGWRSISNKIK